MAVPSPIGLAMATLPPNASTRSVSPTSPEPRATSAPLYAVATHGEKEHVFATGFELWLPSWILSVSTAEVSAADDTPI